MRQALALGLVVSLVVVLACCGAGGAPPGAGTGVSPISVSVSPLAVVVPLGGQQQFNATVQGGGSMGGTVSWGVVGPNKGTIDSSGLYTAPMTFPPQIQVSIVATSTADPTKSATASVTLVLPQPPSAFPILFDVRTQAGWQTPQAPVTAGIPIPPGEISDVNLLRIQTQGGVAQPAQFRVTSRWADGTIRWVLCDFIANLTAVGGVGKYQLNNGGSGNAPPGNLVALDSGGTIEVRTGLLTYVVSKTAFRLFENLFIDRDNDSQVDDPCIDVGVQRGIVITDGVNEFRTDQIAPTRVQIEESGPIRCTVVAEGVHHNTGLGQDKLHYIVRLTSWANLPLVKVSYTFKNMTGHGVAAATPAAAAAQLAQVTTADSIYIDLPLNMGAATLNAAVAGHPTQHPPQQLTAAEFLEINQTYTGTHDALDIENPQPPGFNVGTGDGSSEPLVNAWPDQSDAQIAYSLAGQLSDVGQRNPGWVQLAANQLRLTAVVRDFWQMYPKQLRVQADGMARIGIWPAGSPPLQVFAGSMRTHEVMLALDRLGTVDPGSATLRMNMINDPATAVITPAQLAEAGVFGRIGVTDANLSSTADFIAAAQPLVQAYLGHLVQHRDDIVADRGNGNGAATGHEYGMWNYGDGKTFTPAPGWENNDWEISRACLQWFAASGNMAMHRLFDASARHFRDVDVLHADIGLRFDYTEPGNPAVSGGKATQIGKTRYSPNNKQHDLGNYHLGEHHLDVLKGAFLAEHYLMTGDRLSLDVLREVHLYLRGTWKRFFDPGNGGVDSTVSSPSTWLSNGLYIATAYEVANGLADAAGAASIRNYAVNAVRNRQGTIKPNDPNGDGFSDSTGQFRAWQVGHMLEAMEYTHGNLNDQTFDANIFRCMNWLLTPAAGVNLGNPPTSQPGQFAETPGGVTDFGGPNLMIGAGYPGALAGSGDGTWRNRAQQLLTQQNPKIAFGVVGDAGVRHSTFAQFFRAGPMLLGALRQ